MKISSSVVVINTAHNKTITSLWSFGGPRSDFIVDLSIYQDDRSHRYLISWRNVVQRSVWILSKLRQTWCHPTFADWIRKLFQKKWTQLEIESESLRMFQLLIDKVTACCGWQSHKTIDCAGVIDGIVEPQNPGLAQSAFMNLCHFNQREAM